MQEEGSREASPSAKPPLPVPKSAQRAPFAPRAGLAASAASARSSSCSVSGRGMRHLRRPCRVRLRTHAI